VMRVAEVGVLQGSREKTSRGIPARIVGNSTPQK